VGKMAKRKTSITIDEKLWKEWTMFVVNKTGSARKLSEEMETALKEYMNRSSKDKKGERS
jgi:metal-responsive CopG/Arc/MetJ family transcriptional regulator